MDRRKAELQHKLEALKAAALASKCAATDASQPTLVVEDSPDEVPHGDDDWNDEPQDEHQEDISARVTPTPPLTKPKRRVVPNGEAYDLYQRWQETLPSLVEPLLFYLRRTAGTPVASEREWPSNACARLTCRKKLSRITCLYWDHYSSYDIHSCDCQTLPQALIANGMFPTGPTQPRVAVSTDLLEFYYALFERSGDAVTAVAAALRTFYARRGWHMLDHKGEIVQDPFRRGLGYAIQWYDILRIQVDSAIDRAVGHAKSVIKTYCAKDAEATSSDSFEAPPDLSNPMPKLSECDAILQKRCPACFGGHTFGRSLEQGADFHVAVDGNFMHRHLRSAGDSPAFHNPEYFISKAEVDAVGIHIDEQRKKPPKRSYLPKIPDSAVDNCEKTHDAANGKSKTNGDVFDDTGLMVIVCRHDVPLFFANIDTPGEQQKYSIALITHLFTLIPSNSTVAVFYDISCVIARSAGLYALFPDEVIMRITFATSAMHSYRHEWLCQLIYSPALRPGLGLTDGEGSERTWSRFRKLIGPTRNSGRQRRIWLIDRLAHAVNDELRDDLGDWIQRRLRQGVTRQGATARKTLDECGVTPDELRKEWRLQQEAQLSVRNHAPARLKKELDSVLTLQADIDSLEQTIAATRKALIEGMPSPESRMILCELEEGHAALLSRAEKLYTSLNIHDSFPELRGINLEFVQLLLMARDLKMNIRKRAVASFLEWDRLDQAVGGRANPLGTKLHQQTRKAISRRKPALMSAIRKFNKYCDSMAAMHKPDWSVPVPARLPVQLGALRDDPNLMQDVWVTPCDVPSPRWLADTTIRQGIRALQKVDRCTEERIRLGIEADNLCRWFGSELLALEVAARLPENHLFLPQLDRQRRSLLLRKTRWQNVLASSVRFDSHVSSAAEVARTICGEPNPDRFLWLPPTVVDVTADEDSRHGEIESGGFEEGDKSFDDGQAETEQCVLQDLFDDLDDGDMDELDESHDVHSPEDDVIDEGERMDIDSDLAQAASQSASEQMVDGAEGGVQRSRLFLRWEVPEWVVSDPLKNINNINLFGRDLNAPTTRVQQSCGMFPQLTWTVADIGRLQNTHARLNDTCIDGCIALLYDYFQTAQRRSCAIFTSQLTVWISDKSDDQTLWRNLRRTQYWEKDNWVVPIHQRGVMGHWTIVFVNHRRSEICWFDSLAEQMTFQNDLKKMHVLIGRLLALAGLPEPSNSWTGVPLTTTVMQTNSYDCGVWILAAVSAFFRGSHTLAVVQNDIPNIRELLLKLVLTLPEG